MVVDMPHTLVQHMCMCMHTLEQPRMRGHSVISGVPCPWWLEAPGLVGVSSYGFVSKESSPWGHDLTRLPPRARVYFQPSPPLPAAPSDASPQPSSSPVPPTRAAKLPSAAVRAPFHGSPACSTLSRSAARSDSSCSLALRRA